jgi:hypothetical protein
MGGRRIMSAVRRAAYLTLLSAYSASAQTVAVSPSGQVTVSHSGQVTVSHSGEEDLSRSEDISADFAEAVKLAQQGELAALRQQLAMDCCSLPGLANAVFSSSTRATALHWAAASDQRELAELLLSNGASVSATTVGGATPLGLACAAVNLDMVELLVRRHGAGGEPSCGAAALQAAVSFGKKEAVISLLQGGAQVRARVPTKVTATAMLVECRPTRTGASHTRR